MRKGVVLAPFSILNQTPPDKSSLTISDIPPFAEASERRQGTQEEAWRYLNLVEQTLPAPEEPPVYRTGIMRENALRRSTR